MEFFGEDCDLRKITPGQCDDFRENLNRTLAENTVRKTLSRCKQFFRAAVRKRIISENPLGDMKNIVVTANRSRDHFVTEAEAMAVLRSCPDAEWRLIFSLARWGGLRIPSELLELRWGDVDWENEMLVIRSPKTQQYQGHESREMPLWPELRPYLQMCLDDLRRVHGPKANVDDVPVIRRYRLPNANLRTRLMRIIKAAGLTPWEKLFQNLRTTRATELKNEHGGDDAADWLGHSTKVAKGNYWQRTLDHQKQALAKAKAAYSAARAAATNGIDGN